LRLLSLRFTESQNAGGRRMKPIKSTIAFLALSAFSFFSCSGHGETAGGGSRFADANCGMPDGVVEPVSSGASLAERNCAWCHGSSGQGFATAPQLAGQRRAYIEKQLRNFQDHTRDAPLSQAYMWDAAARLSPQTECQLAIFFSTLDAEPADDGDKELTARGQTIFADGLPDSNIPSCIACHGPNAEGAGAIPRLAGQSYYYLKRRLEQWGAGYHTGAQPPMPQIASKLSTDQIESLASYLSFAR
jgi:cytochrome c553